MVNASSVMNARLTDKGMSIESEMVDKGLVMQEGLTCHLNQ